MTKVTRITTQKRSKSRYNIFIDDGTGEKYGFSVDEDILIEFNLRRGLELDDSMIHTLVQQDTLLKSYHQVIGYLGYRMRTKKEIRDYLIKKEVDNEHIIKIIEKLVDRKLVNDAEFATLFVNTRINTSAKGPGLVRQELIAKGVTSSIANKAVEQFDYGIQHEKATSLVEKGLSRSSNHSFQKQTQQLRSVLMRNGFSQEVIRDVLADIQEEKDVDEELAALTRQAERLQRRHQDKFSGYELRNKIKEGLYRQGFSLRSIDEYLDGMNEE